VTNEALALKKLSIQKERSGSMNNNMRVILAKRREKVSELSKATGISKSTLTDLYYERSESPKLSTIIKLTQYLGVTIDEFFNVEK
jgi:HTH DNA binding protein, phage associated